MIRQHRCPNGHESEKLQEMVRDRETCDAVRSPQGCKEVDTT